MFLKYQELYKHEVSLEAVLQILKLIILSGMVCLSIFSGGVVTYVCLVSVIHGYWLNDFMFFEQISPSIIIFLIMPFGYQENKLRYSKSLWRILKEIVVKWWLLCVFTCWLVLQLGMLELSRWNRFWWS
jgi:hypothetical protein